MHEAIQHCILLVILAGLSAIGWFMAHNPVRVYQAFDLAGLQLLQSFGVAVCRIMGWFFAIFSAAGALMQAILLVYALVR